MTITIQFSGSAWLIFFHMGVAQFLQKHYKMTDKYFRFSGNSGGALIATGLIHGLNAKKLYYEVLRFHEQPTSVFQNIYKAFIDFKIPDEKWHNVKDRLFIGVTEVSFTPTIQLVPKTISKFRNARDGANILSHSCNLPIVGTYFPKNGFYDGGLSVTYPVIPETTRNIKVNYNTLEDADIKPPISFPKKWLLYPPSIDTISKIAYLGNLCAAEFFSKEDNQLPKRFIKNDEFVGIRRIRSEMKKTIEAIQEEASKVTGYF